jgi:hypothetical protein
MLPWFITLDFKIFEFKTRFCKSQIGRLLTKIGFMVFNDNYKAIAKIMPLVAKFEHKALCEKGEV